MATRKIRAVAGGRDWIEVTAAALDAGALTAWVADPACGAVVTFCGTVRDSSTDRAGVEALEYETDEALALDRLSRVVAAARERWPDLGDLVVHHRVGRVELTEPTVVVVAAAPHRAEAFDAARYLIDELKASVPIYKRDVWAGASDWSRDAAPLADAPRAPRA
ncbi:MAG TPA: molybdenum cofactor biosynthesis protein MoaE [Acidimicrobiales bacterium]|nr:molybdenum cofactor biosynthesis protein MoaE [Acidimicrobiales bacterium]